MGARLGELGAHLLRQPWFARAPIRLFDLGLGVLFAGRLLMVEHTGRRTGLPRRVVLELVDRPSADTYLVASGFGAKSQWVRNVAAEPHVRLWVGRRRGARATATLLPAEDAATAVDRYARRHPWAWAALTPVFEATLGAPVGELPMVAITVLPPVRQG